jgi:Cu+-exporting ATPase
MKIRDPVCRMECDDKSAAFKSEYEGKTYCFCSLSCKKKFEENPKKYLEFWSSI